MVFIVNNIILYTVDIKHRYWPYDSRISLNVTVNPKSTFSSSFTTQRNDNTTCMYVQTRPNYRIEELPGILLQDHSSENWHRPTSATLLKSLHMFFNLSTMNDCKINM